MRRSGFLPGAAVVAGVLVLNACGGGGGEPTEPGPVAVASVSVTPGTTSIAPLETAQLTATVRDAQGSVLPGRAVSWSSSDQGKVTVAGSGLVTGVAAGTVTITATSEGKSGSAQVTVVAPVATVEVTAPSTTLVPQQTLQLTAALKDGVGAPLTGRSVTWSSSQPAVATVSQAGLVSALAAGATTITATSEGRSGGLTVDVVAGTLVGTSGGVVTGGNGGIQLTIPPGAVTSPTPVTITQLPAPPGGAPPNALFNGATYRIGPAGTTFSQPVTVTLKYDAAALPGWAMTGDLGIFAGSGGAWTALSNVSVNTTAGTVTGTTTTLGASVGGAGRGGRGGAGAVAQAQTAPTDVTGGVNYASVTLTPSSGSVNFQQRSVSFHAGLVPTGTGIPLTAAGASAPSPQWKFRWRTTGQNGTLGGGMTVTGWTTAMDQQYIATNPVLDQLSGQIDMVYVDVLLNPSQENNPAAQVIVTRQASIDADLETTYEVSPSDKTIGAGQSASFQLVIRARDGSILQPRPNTEITWQSSGNHGTLNAGQNQPAASYQARTTFTAPPPRVDDITVNVTGVTTVTERQVVWDFSQIPPRLQVVHENTVTRQLQGDARGFVTVKVDYQVQLQPASSKITAGGTQQLQAVLTPAYDGPGLAFKWNNSANQGTLNVANGAHSQSRQPTYTSGNFPTGGTDNISVHVVSFVGGTELETLGSAQASIEVDPWRTAYFIVTQSFPSEQSTFTAATLRVPKVAGAGTYIVEGTIQGTPYNRTISGATSTNQYSVGEVLDGGTYWYINMEAGFNTVPSAAQARFAQYQAKYGPATARYRVTQ